jgi:hypothetical protein
MPAEGGFIGRRPRVWGCGSGRRGFRSGARGLHPVRQRCGTAMAGVGHGAGACVAPARVTVGIGRGRGKRARKRLTGWGPRGSETRREMKGRRAGWLWWAERVGGLAVCANQRRVSGCWRELSKLRCGPRCTGSSPNFSSLSSYLTRIRI